MAWACSRATRSRSKAGDSFPDRPLEITRFEPGTQDRSKLSDPIDFNHYLLIIYINLLLAPLASAQGTLADMRGKRKMRFRHACATLCFQAAILEGCFTPQLLDTPYQEPIESQREFAEEFDNPVHLGNRWKPISGWWQIKTGRLIQRLPWRSSLPGGFQMLYVYGLASGPYEVETRLAFLSDGDQGAGILLRFQDQNNFYLLRMRHYKQWQDYMDLTQYVNGVRREDLRRSDLSIKPGEWYTLRAEDRGNEIVAFLGGNEVFSFPTKDRPMGTVGLAVKTGRVAFEDFSASLHEPGLGSRPIAVTKKSPDSSSALRPLTVRVPNTEVSRPQESKLNPVPLQDW